MTIEVNNRRTTINLLENRLWAKFTIHINIHIIYLYSMSFCICNFDVQKRIIGHYADLPV